MNGLRNYPSLLAGVLCATIAASAGAQTMRVPVGDLTTRDGVRAFDRRLEQTAERFCAARYLLMELDKLAACRDAVRDEALAQLSPAQRQAYDSARPGERLAWNAH